jgi:hypothetical protein
MNKKRSAERILKTKPEGRRNRGRPVLRWEDGVDNEIN